MKKSNYSLRTGVNMAYSILRTWSLIAFFLLSGIILALAGSTDSQADQPQAPNVKVTGRVTDIAGQPLIGVSVVLDGTLRGTITNSEGSFAIEVPVGSVLQFSYIGYSGKKVSIEKEESLTISLSENIDQLNEVVVMGYGANTRKADLSASIGILENMETLKSRPVTSAASMLQGQIAGVTVVNDGGDPTSTPSIVIRGQGSQSSEDVLWVVDGVPNAPFSINEVESMVVLKDAASAAIYGAYSGSAGVILVTTKKAKEGMPSVTYEGTIGIRSAANLPQSLTIEQEKSVRQQSYEAAGYSMPNGWDSSVNPYIATTRTDWIDEIFRSALYQRHNLAFNAGTENFSNRISLQYDNDEGTLISTFNKYLRARYNSVFKISKYVQIREDLTWTNHWKRGADTDNGYYGAVLSALMMPRNAEAYYDGTYGPAGQYGGTAPYSAEYYGGQATYADIHGDVVNPVRILTANTTIDKTRTVATSTFLDLMNLFPGFKFTSRFSYRGANYFYKNFTPRRLEPGKINDNNTLEYSTYTSSNWEAENTANYDNSFGKHTVGGMVSTTANGYSKRGFEASAEDFENESEAYQYLNWASTMLNSKDSYESDKNVSVVSRLAYSYDDRYFMTASWRRDYAGRLPDGHKSGDFPAVTGAWKISSEKFLPENDLLTLLKVRASWGRVGNLGSIDYAYGDPTLSIKVGNYGGQVGSTSPYATNMIYLGTAYNQNLTWETSEQTNVGLDMNLFKTRLSVSADYFEKRTYDLIQEQTSGWPTYLGVSGMLVNQGEIRNRGLELVAGWNDVIGKDFSWFVNANFSTLKNWVSDIGSLTDTGEKSVWTHNDSFRNTHYPYQTAEGKPLYSYYLIKTAGIFQSDEEAGNYVSSDGTVIQPNAQAGDLKFIDQNDDGLIDSNDKIYMGSYIPKITGSLTAGFNYRNLGFSFMLQGAAKSKAFNASKYLFLNESVGNFNRSTDILDAWSETNTGSSIPRLTANDVNGNFDTTSDYYLEDASYLRIKNITVSYDLTELLHKSSVLSLRSSSLSAAASVENLHTFTKYTGIDPEVGGIGLDQLKYPVSRVFSFTVKLTY